MNFRDVNPYEYIEWRGRSLNIPKVITWLHITSSIAHICAVLICLLYDYLLSGLVFYAGISYFTLMALALSRQPYKQLFAGIYVIYLGIMTAMFLISGCIGVVKTITEGCDYPPSDEAVCHCIITQIININMVFLPWVLSGFLGAFTFIFYQYYEYLAFEANKNKPEVGTSNAPNEPTPENPFKKIVLLCGITLDVTKMARWVDVICFTVFIEGYAVQFVLFDSPIARLCVAPILFGLSHFVIYVMVHRMQTFERHRVVVTGSFVCFLVLYTLLLLVYGIYNIFVHSNALKEWSRFTAMTCFLSAFCFGSSVFYFYQYALYLEHEKNNGGIRLENMENVLEEGGRKNSLQEHEDTDNQQQKPNLTIA